MKALFLAGGMGTRLRPLTDELPKPMVPIMNKPLLERSMVRLVDFGIHEMVISTGHKSQYIEEYFGDGRPFGLEIEYVGEDSPLGTGGAIKNAGHLLNETFLVFNADILCNLNFDDLIEFHRNHSAAVTIAVTEVDDPSAYGVIEYDRHGYAVSFTEKPPADQIRSNLINAGIYVMEPAVLEEIPSGRPVSIEREIFPALLKKGYKIAVFNGCSYWMDIGTPEKYLHTHEDIMTGTCRLSGLEFAEQAIIWEGQSFVDPSAKLIGPLYIGLNAHIEADAVIGPYAVLGKNVHVQKGGIVANSVLWNEVVLGDHAEMRNAIAGTACNLSCNTALSNSTLTTSGRADW